MNTAIKAITTETIRSAIDWSIGVVRRDHPPGTYRFPQGHYDMAEHFSGFYTLGYTMTVCDDTVGGLKGEIDGITSERLAQIAAGTWPYASLDYDAECSCCGAWAFAGCEDIYHGREDEAAARIFATFQAFKPACDCWGLS